MRPQRALLALVCLLQLDALLDQKVACRALVLCMLLRLCKERIEGVSLKIIQFGAHLKDPLLLGEVEVAGIVEEQDELLLELRK